MKKLLFVFSMLFFNISHAQIIYNSWLSNDEGVGNYIFTISHDEANNKFNYHLTVDPWNAEVLGLFVDFAALTNVDENNLNFTSINGDVNVFAYNTDSSSCGHGCNINGLLNNINYTWDYILNFGQQGFEGINDFSWSSYDFDLTLDELAALNTDGSNLIAVRSQQLCHGDETLTQHEDNGCDDSDKAYTSIAITDDKTPIPEPSTSLLIIGALIALAILRKHFIKANNSRVNH